MGVNRRGKKARILIIIYLMLLVLAICDLLLNTNNFPLNSLVLIMYELLTVND